MSKLWLEQTLSFQEVTELYDDHFGRSVTSHADENVADPANTNGNELEYEEVGVEENLIEQFLSTNESALAAVESVNLEANEQITSRPNCNCQKDCLSLFCESEVKEHIYSLRELEKSEKEFFIMGILNRLGCLHNPGTDGKLPRLEYKFRGTTVCKDAFCLLFDIGNFTLRALISHIRNNGLVKREHGNKGKRPHNALTYDDILRVVNYIRNKAEEVGLPMAAAPRGSDGLPPTYLPAAMTKSAMHAEYVACCAEEDVRVLKYSTFTETWRACCPNIKIASPRDDVCSKCELYRKQIIDARSECDKISSCAAFSRHIETAQKERELYRAWVKDAQSGDVNKTHYTFDFAQLVTVPHHGRQMGPLYFVTPRRVHVFGFRIDGAPRQVNYLIDESNTPCPDGKGIHGPNAVISMLDDALQKFGAGEDECGLHADNCFGMFIS